MPDQHIKILTLQRLKRLNNKAIRVKANRTLSPTYLARMSSDHIYPITSTLLHNDVDMRCRIVLNGKGDIGELDMTLADYEDIPYVRYEKEVPCAPVTDSDATPASPPPPEATSSGTSSPATRAVKTSPSPPVRTRRVPRTSKSSPTRARTKRR